MLIIVLTKDGIHKKLILHSCVGLGERDEILPFMEVIEQGEEAIGVFVELLC
jgi:hypothetical protein